MSSRASTKPSTRQASNLTNCKTIIIKLASKVLFYINICLRLKVQQFVKTRMMTTTKLQNYWRDWTMEALGNQPLIKCKFTGQFFSGMTEDASHFDGFNMVSTNMIKLTLWFLKIWCFTFSDSFRIEI